MSQLSYDEAWATIEKLSAQRRALRAEVEKFVRLSDQMAHEWKEGDWRGVLTAVREQTEAMRAVLEETRL